MANNCQYDMRVTGKKKNIQEFLQVLRYEHPTRMFYRVFEAECEDTDEDLEEYSDEEIITTSIYGSCAWSLDNTMCRTLTFKEKSLIRNEIIKNKSEYRDKVIARLFESYQKECKSIMELQNKVNEIFNKYKEINYIKNEDGEKVFTNLQIESYLLELSIVIYSEEYGNCFEEHFVYDKGCELEAESEDATEICIGDIISEYEEAKTDEERQSIIENFQELLDEYENEINEPATIELLNRLLSDNGEWLKFGGYIEKNFEIEEEISEEDIIEFEQTMLFVNNDELE